jgi:hypothetical protein
MAATKLIILLSALIGAEFYCTIGRARSDLFSDNPQQKHFLKKGLPPGGEGGVGERTRM